MLEFSRIWGRMAFPGGKEQKDTEPGALKDRVVVGRDHVSMGIVGLVGTGGVTKRQNACLAAWVLSSRSLHLILNSHIIPVFAWGSWGPGTQNNAKGSRSPDSVLIRVLPDRAWSQLQPLSRHTQHSPRANSGLFTWKGDRERGLALEHGELRPAQWER